MSRLWRSNCEPYCFSVLCHSSAAAGVAGGRLTKLENNESVGKQCCHNGTARSLPFHPRWLQVPRQAPALFHYSTKNRAGKNTASYWRNHWKVTEHGTCPFQYETSIGVVLVDVVEGSTILRFFIVLQRSKQGLLSLFIAFVCLLEQIYESLSILAFFLYFGVQIWGRI